MDNDDNVGNTEQCEPGSVITGNPVELTCIQEITDTAKLGIY